MRPLLLLLCLCFVGSHALTFSCEQVKKLIKDKTIFTTDNACVALDEYISTTASFANEVYFQDGGGRGGKYSLAEISIVGCVSSSLSTAQWQIVTDRVDGGEGIDCSYQFTVLFSSIETVLLTAKNDGLHHRSYKAYNYTVVAPRGGLLIDFSCNNTQEQLNFYTGLGNGAAEEMFYYGSSLCDDRLSLYAWDTALTVNVPVDGYILMTYTGTGSYLALGSVSYDMIVMGSGRSNAIVQHGDDEKFMWLTPSISDDLKFLIDGSAQFSPSNSLVLTTHCRENNCTGETIPISDLSVHLFIEADFLALNYNTVVPDNVWKNDDLFFLKITTSAYNSTEAPPTAAPVVNTTYSCGCDLTSGLALFSSNLWIDVIFVVDVSKSIGSAGIAVANSHINSILSSLTLDSTKEKYSRVGIIAASDTIEIFSTLSSPHDSNISLQIGEAEEADIGSGIKSAIDMFSSSTRSTRQLIYVYSASDSSNTRNLQTYDATYDANKFKIGGGIIATVDVYGSLQSSFLPLSSNGYYSAGFNTNFNVDLQLMCDVNCFCPTGLTPLPSPDSDRNTADDGCYHTQSSTDPYFLAKEACLNEGGSITTIHDNEKQFFLLQMISQFGKVPFWIGLEKFGNEWQWVDQDNSTFSLWSGGQPSGTGQCAYSKQTTGLNNGWFAEDCSKDHYYICERAPCSVDRFCK